MPAQVCKNNRYRMYVRISDRVILFNIGSILIILDGNADIGAHLRRAIFDILSVQGNWLDREQSQIGFFSTKRPILAFSVISWLW